MLRNLLLALFLFVLAFPAIAMPEASAQTSQAAEDCHGMPMEQQNGDTQHPENNGRLHGCIGCVAPQEPGLAFVAVLPLPFVVQQQIERELVGNTQRPSIPPPRNWALN